MLLSVLWYNGTRTVMSWIKDVRIGNLTLYIHTFSIYTRPRPYFGPTTNDNCYVQAMSQINEITDWLT